MNGKPDQVMGVLRRVAGSGNEELVALAGDRPVERVKVTDVEEEDEPGQRGVRQRAVLIIRGVPPEGDRIPGAVSSSVASTERLQALGIPVFDANDVGDIAIAAGADNASELAECVRVRHVAAEAVPLDQRDVGFRPPPFDQIGQIKSGWTCAEDGNAHK